MCCVAFCVVCCGVWLRHGRAWQVEDPLSTRHDREEDGESQHKPGHGRDQGRAIPCACFSSSFRWSRACSLVWCDNHGRDKPRDDPHGRDSRFFSFPCFSRSLHGLAHGRDCVRPSSSRAWSAPREIFTGVILSLALFTPLFCKNVL